MCVCVCFSFEKKEMKKCQCDCWIYKNALNHQWKRRAAWHRYCLQIDSVFREAPSRSPRPAAAELPADEWRLRPVRHVPSFFFKGHLLLFPFKSPFTCSATLLAVLSSPPSPPLPPSPSPSSPPLLASSAPFPPRKSYCSWCTSCAPENARLRRTSSEPFLLCVSSSWHIQPARSPRHHDYWLVSQGDTIRCNARDFSRVQRNISS